MVKKKILVIFSLILVMGIVNFISAAASFQVTGFSCSPSETAINSVFSCTATIKNNGDSAGTLNTATLYPSSNWLEDSNYAQAYGQSVGAGQSIGIIFTGLRATKSGNNGFSKIMLDSVEDKYVSDQNKKVNVVNVVVSITNSASSANMGNSWTTEADVIVGGNVNVVLGFAVDSGGCSINSQQDTETWNGMSDGSSQSKTWTVTQGTGDSARACRFTITAIATGTGGVASKSDSTSKTVSCPNCPVDPIGGNTGGSGGGGGSGSGGGGATSSVLIKESQLIAGYSKDFISGEAIKFNVDNTNHTFTTLSVSNTEAIILIESKKQTFKLKVKEEIKVDLNEDNNADISVKLNSINTLTKKASLTIKKLVGSVENPTASLSGNVGKTPTPEEKINEINKGQKTSNFYIIFSIILILIIIIVIVGIFYSKSKKYF